MKSSLEILREYMIRPKGMMVWRDVPGYHGLYQISNHGDVCSVTNDLVSPDYTYAVLARIDKSRHNISKKKLLRTYWKEEERFSGEERWKRLDHYGDYYISNYANVKNCKRLILLPTKGRVTLQKTGDRKRRSFTILSVFLMTFPPYEIEINHETKSVNYVKKNENISDTSLKKSA